MCCSICKIFTIVESTFDKTLRQLMGNQWNSWEMQIFSGTVSYYDFDVCWWSIVFQNHALMSCICFFCWDILVICLTVLLKLTITLFFSLYFKTFWLKWLNFFDHFKKVAVYARKRLSFALASKKESLRFFFLIIAVDKNLPIST